MSIAESEYSSRATLASGVKKIIVPGSKLPLNWGVLKGHFWGSRESNKGLRRREEIVEDKCQQLKASIPVDLH